MDVILVIIAIAVAGRYFASTAASAKSQPVPPIVAMADSDWLRATSGSHALGPTRAAVQVVVFFDFQCPYCATTDTMLARLLKVYPTQIRMAFRHFPLGFHRSARTAAAALECARTLGSASSLHERLFERQKVLDNLRPQDYGRLADARDVTAFASCMDSAPVRAVIDSDIMLGARIGVMGTPALFVNRVRLPSVSAESLRTLIVGAIDGTR